MKKKIFLKPTAPPKIHIWIWKSSNLEIALKSTLKNQRKIFVLLNYFLRFVV